MAKTARYFQYGGTHELKRLFVCTHGYAMNAKFFIKKFETLADAHTAVITPEGLHRFYIQGSGGRVGASWMTKEDRLTDIADNINYIERCVERAGAKSDTPIIALGFSQGFHTLVRWAVQSRFLIERITAWGSHFPEDVLTSENRLFFQNTATDVVWGNADEYITKEKMRVHLQDVKNYGFSPHFEEYQGTHKIYPEVLQKLYVNE